MAIVKLMLVKASGRFDELDNFIEACRKSGEFHAENACSVLSESMGFYCPNELNPYSATLQTIKELAAVSGITLQRNKQENSPLEDDEIPKYISELEYALQTFYADRKRLLEELEARQNIIKQFENFDGLDVPVEDTTSCEFLSVRYGRLPREQLVKLDAYDDNPYVYFIPCRTDHESCWGVYFAPKDKIHEVDSIFAFMFFDRIRVPAESGTPAEIVARLEAAAADIRQKLAELDTVINSFWINNRASCAKAYERLQWLSDSFELRRLAAVHGGQYYFIFWTPAHLVEKFTKRFDEMGNISYDISETDDAERITPPVKLKNNRVFRAFETFVNMYGLPSAKGMDATAFVALTYTLIFGIMFGDLGQGFVLALAGLVAWKFMGMAFGKLLIPLGFSSMFFGLMYGSFFGYEEVLDPLYHAIGLPGKPLDVMHEINTVLVVSIGIGVALMIVSMGINIYCSLRRKSYAEAFFGNSGVAGLIVYCTLVLLVYGFMSGNYLLPGWANAVLLIPSLAALFAKEKLAPLVEKDRHHEDPAKLSDFLMQNVFELIEYILAYFSNTMSFLRVGAFVLVHAGMMMVVFSLAGDPPNIFIVAIGNLLVIVLEGLIAGIQALRLEFYEMFSRFFEGDGRPFLTVEETVGGRD